MVNRNKTAPALSGYCRTAVDQDGRARGVGCGSQTITPLAISSAWPTRGREGGSRRHRTCSGVPDRLAPPHSGVATRSGETLLTRRGDSSRTRPRASASSAALMAPRRTAFLLGRMLRNIEFRPVARGDGDMGTQCGERLCHGRADTGASANDQYVLRCELVHISIAW